MAKMSKRDLALSHMRVAGYHDNRVAFTRLYLESKISLQVANDAWNTGKKQKKSGMPCSCVSCQNGANNALEKGR